MNEIAHLFISPFFPSIWRILATGAGSSRVSILRKWSISRRTAIAWARDLRRGLLAPLFCCPWHRPIRDGATRSAKLRNGDTTESGEPSSSPFSCAPFSSCVWRSVDLLPPTIQDSAKVLLSPKPRNNIFNLFPAPPEVWLPSLIVPTQFNEMVITVLVDITKFAGKLRVFLFPRRPEREKLGAQHATSPNGYRSAW